MPDRFFARCPFCGCPELIENIRNAHAGYGSVTAEDNMLGGTILYHTVCRNCGSVVRSYVKEPEKLLKRSERRY